MPVLARLRYAAFRLQRSRPLQLLLVFITFSATIAILFLIFRKDVLLILDEFAHFIKTHGFLGAILPCLLIVAVSFPPLFGYSLLLTLNGFIFGIPLGFLLNYISALTGSILCFLASRYLGRSLLQHFFNFKSDDEELFSGLNGQQSYRYRPVHLNTLNSTVGGDSASSSAEMLVKLKDLKPSSAVAGAALTLEDSPSLGAVTGTSSALTSPKLTVASNVNARSSTTSTLDKSSTGDLEVEAGNNCTMRRPSAETSPGAEDEPEGVNPNRNAPSKYVRLFRALSKYLAAHERETYRLLILLRLAPYPFNVMNALLAQIPTITLQEYVVSTAIGLLKVILHTITGSMLVELEDVIKHPEQQQNGLSATERIDLVILFLSVSFGLVSGVYLYRILQHALAEVDDEEVSVH